MCIRSQPQIACGPPAFSGRWTAVMGRPKPPRALAASVFARSFAFTGSPEQSLAACATRPASAPVLSASD